MADETADADDSPAAKADTLALAEQAEADAAEAEALAVAARARAKAIALRRAANTAVDTDGDNDDADSVTDDEPARSRRSKVLEVAAVIAICGFLAVSGYLAWCHHTATREKEQTAAFAGAARQELINLTSFDFRHAKEGVQRVLDNATGEFRDDFASRAADFTTVVEKSQVVTEGRVGAVAVESMDTDSAVVLVAATSNVTNAAGAEEELRVWRMRLTVTREGDEYKVSKVVMVP